VLAGAQSTRSQVGAGGATCHGCMDSALGKAVTHSSLLAIN